METVVFPFMVPLTIVWNDLPCDLQLALISLTTFRNGLRRFCLMLTHCVHLWLVQTLVAFVS